MRYLEALYPAPGILFLLFDQSTLLLPSGFIEISRLTSHARGFYLKLTITVHFSFLQLKGYSQIKATVLRTATKKLHSSDLV